jgi:glutamate-1-semialdehyde 2,1-aminomutase
MKGTGQQLWEKAKTLIPGGSQLLSKRAELFAPQQWPAYYSRAEGAYVWDLDGKKYLDMLNMGIGSCMLGYADSDVNAAVIDAINRGSMTTLNSPEEVALAELLLDLHPWAQMVRYARAGGESMAVAARIARAYTARETIAFCGYHGWADWYLATNLQSKDGLADHLLAGLEPKGVPHGLAGTVLPFHYNKIEELEEIVAKNPKLAAIIMEPMHGEYPKDNFLEKVREIATRIGAVLIFDEITIGFRLTVGGAHLVLGIEPDMAIFGKGMSNGYAMAAIIGKRDVMQAAQDTFISSTYWTEAIGPTAALAAIKKMQRINLPEHLSYVGGRVKEIWEETAARHGLTATATEVLPLLFFSFKDGDGRVMKTLFVQEMLKRGILATTQFYASYVHTDEYIEIYANALSDVFALMAKAVRDGNASNLLNGPVAHSGFQRLN